MEAHFIEKQIQIAVQELQKHYNSQLNSIKHHTISYYQLVFNKMLIWQQPFYQTDKDEWTKLQLKSSSQLASCGVQYLENQIQFTWMHIL